MKKIVVLIVAFLIIFFGIFLIPEITQQSVIDIQTVTPDIIDYELKSTASGTIKRSDKIEINLDFDAVIGNFTKQVGEKVDKGDTLFIIDKDKTIDLLKQTYSSEEIALYQDYIDAYPIEFKSEYDGVITSINDSEIVYAGNSIIEISAGSGFIASVFVSEKDISNINLGQNVEISGEAFGDKTYNGRVIYIAEDAAEHTVGANKETSVNVTVSIDNPDNKLKAGYNIKANIVYATMHNAVTIPYEALREDENSYYVYKLYNKNFVYKSKVNVLYEDNDFLIVSGNINDNTKLCIVNNTINEDIVRVNVTDEGIEY